MRAKLALPAEVVLPPEVLAMTPLEVMLRAMRQHYGEGDIQAALMAAGMAAPYVHARLSASAVTVHHTTGRSDDDIAHEIEGLRRRIERAQAAEHPPLIEATAGEVVEPVGVAEPASPRPTAGDG
jgi:hypothetical protein